MSALAFPSLKEFTERATVGERRAVVRYHSDREVPNGSSSEYERIWARVTEISVDGISLLVSREFTIGAYIVIEMKTKDPGSSLSLLARVAHSMQQADDSWFVGCAFVIKPTQEQISALP